MLVAGFCFLHTDKILVNFVLSTVLGRCQWLNLSDEYSNVSRLVQYQGNILPVFISLDLLFKCDQVVHNSPDHPNTGWTVLKLISFLLFQVLNILLLEHFPCYIQKLTV